MKSTIVSNDKYIPPINDYYDYCIELMNNGNSIEEYKICFMYCIYSFIKVIGHNRIIVRDVYGDSMGYRVIWHDENKKVYGCVIRMLK